KHMNGDSVVSEAMIQRRDELDAGYEDLQARWRDLLNERRNILDDFGADEESIQKREAHFKKVQALKDEETTYRNRLGRFLQHQRDLRDLQRLQLVVNTLNWPEGHSLDGSGPLAQYLASRPLRSTIWFQPASDTRNQVWTGLFRDSDGNFVMEFAPD